MLFKSKYPHVHTSDNIMDFIRVLCRQTSTHVQIQHAKLKVHLVLLMCMCV